MKFEDLPVGEIFQFNFEKGSKWVYEKVSEDTMKTIGSPNMEKTIIGSTYTAGPNLTISEVHIIPAC